MIKRLSALVCLLLWCAFHAGAADRVLTTREIKGRQQVIRSDLEAGKVPFAAMTRAQKQSVLSNQKKLDALLEGVTDTAQLDARDRDKVFDLVARIDATLQGEDALVCTQEARTGSNFMTRVCRMPAEIREQKEASQKMLGEERARTKCADASGCM